MNGDWINDIEDEVSGMAKSRRTQDTAAVVDDSERLSTTADMLLADMAGEWVRHKQRRRVWTWVFRIAVLLLLLAIAGMLLQRLIGDSPSKGEPYTVTVSLKGPVIEGEEASAESLRTRLTKAMEDENAAGVLLLIDSPGGSPVQAGLMYDDIVRLRDEYPDKPVHAVIGNLAASAGYYIACATENIYANQASLVGSIGVRLDSFGAVDAMQRLGFERRLLTAGEHKGLLDPFSPIDEKANAHLQAVLDSVHDQFIAVVKQGRGDRLSADPDLFTGLVWNGMQAVELGLVDDLMDVHAVARDVIGAEDLMPLEEEKSLLDRVAHEIGVAVARALSPRTGLQ